MTYDQRFPNMREYRSKLELDIYKIGGLIEGFENEGKNTTPLTVRQEHDRKSLQELELLLDAARQPAPVASGPPRLPLSLMQLTILCIILWLLSTLATYLLLVRV